MNNADRIRSMSNEELAAFLVSIATGNFEECSLWELYGEDEALYWITDYWEETEDDNSHSY